MRLTLRIGNYCGEPPADPQVRSFDSFPIILGRSTECNYVLNDPSQYVSSNHAVILLESSQLHIQDTSSNGVYVNGAAEAVGRGRSRLLEHADTLAIGDYTLSVAVEDPAQPALSQGANDPFGNFSASVDEQSNASSSSHFDPFRGEAPDWTQASEHAEGISAQELDLGESSVAVDELAATSDPADWANWSDDISHESGSDSTPGVASRNHASSARQADPFPIVDDDLDWLPGTNDETTPVSLPLPGPAARSSAEPAQSRAAHSGAAHSGAAHSSAAPSGAAPSGAAPSGAAPSGGAPSRAKQPRAAKPRATRPGAARQATGQAAEPALSARAVAAARNSRTADDSSAQLGILLRAASLRDSDFADRDSTEVLEQTGRLLTQMVDAMMVLLKSRAELKNVIRSDVTTLTRSDNNPLKFSLSAEDALSKMLSDDSQGYLQSDTAIQEAVEDLKLHQVAMLEGMKSAVKSLLLQFDPEKLSRKLEKTGGITASIPIKREARLWELFCEQYDVIHDEAVSDFSELFGAEFRKAYEKRIMKTGRRPDF